MNDKPIDNISDKRMTSDNNKEYMTQWKLSGNCVSKTGEELLIISDDMGCDEQIAQLDGEVKTMKTNNGLTNGTTHESNDTQINGFDRGYRPFKILGAKEVDKSLMFLVMFREDLTKADLIPNHVLHEKCPQMLIKYYEKNTLWKRH